MRKDDYVIIVHRGESDESMYTAAKVLEALAAATFFLMHGKPGWSAEVRWHGQVVWSDSW